VTAIQAVRIRNGRLYAGTFGQGVRVSDDLGTSWQDFNQGLVGGFEDSQLDVVDLQFRGDDLFAATAGAGVYSRKLSGPGGWQPFGGVFELNQAANVTALAVGGGRLLASAGGNGMVFAAIRASPSGRSPTSTTSGRTPVSRPDVPSGPEPAGWWDDRRRVLQ
jgi:hypothetical protein